MIVEGLEQRQLLAAGVVPTLPPATSLDLPAFTSPRNVGTVPAFSASENEGASESGANDSFLTAQEIPLGNLPGQESTIDLVGSSDFTINPITGIVQGDIDIYAVDLQAGDILDISVQGTLTQVSVHGASGQFLWGTDQNQGIAGYSGSSPLQTTGNAVMAQVVPESGRYYIFGAGTTAGSGSYTIGLRTYRPVTESLPIGQQQVLYLDFDGGTFLPSQFSRFIPAPGFIRIPSLQESLPLVGIQQNDEANMLALVDHIVSEVEKHFQSVATNGTNGDYDSTGTPGEYGITIVSSFDFRNDTDATRKFEFLANPLVTRVLIGGTTAGIGIPDILGVAPSGDIGNFDLSELVLAPMDLVQAYSTQFPIANGSSVLDAVAETIAVTASHEAAHVFGMEHTDGNNLVGSLIDGVGTQVPAFDLGVGPDGIFGTLDDTEIEFVTDQFDLTEGYLGTQFVPAALSHVLSTGTAGGSVSGRVFSDANRDGNGATDAGLAGVTVFADVNGNGLLDPTDPSAVTGADGTYTLGVTPGTFNIIALTPTQFAGTTVLSQSATIALGGAVTGVNFGFNQVIPDITGTKFADVDGDGIFDTNERGIGGVYIYLDLDGDDRPDLGEPGDITAADGTYSINFPGPGTYTIREVIGPGFQQTFPVGGEHTVTYDGTALTNNYNFGNLPSRDFGDAPDSYRTTLDADGPSHGLLDGLRIGNAVDRDLDGRPGAAADGDDVNGLLDINGNVIDDEDGLRLLSPLGPGATSTVEVSLTNSTGTAAYLQAWVDFNGDGDFEDVINGISERVATDLLLGTGQHILPVTVPIDAETGTTYARLRYSQTPGLGIGGDADTGEVEDHAITILTGTAVTNDDDVSVSRNSLSNRLDVLANDFQTAENQLTIINLNLAGTRGQVRIATDGKSVDYTPPNGFIGRDTFEYTVRDEFGQTSSAQVNVTVTFQSAQPIAVDDTFDVPQGSVNRALNVLDNDVPSIAGGISITSVTPGTSGGTITIIGGGQSLRYTPLPGFNGTEQFTYSIQDANGVPSTAQVTVNLLPGAQNDDLASYTVEIIDPINQRPVENVRVGDTFGVRVSVDDLRGFDPSGFDPEGVVSGFLDLLYTDELVATVDTNANPNFPFDITFGPLFTGSNLFQQGDSQTPGLLNELGGTQSVGNQQSHFDPAVLFTVTMQAVSPGVAVFQADPADEVESETILLGQDTPLTVNQIRLGRTELLIAPASDNFTSAIDDSFPDGRDSDGFVITATSIDPAVLDVIDNDNLGDTGTIQEFGIVTAPSLGNVEINDNGTPTNLNDDFVEYRANVDANGFDSFTYVIVTADGIRSTAEVTLAIGNAGDDDIVAIDFALVNEAGVPISQDTGVTVGDRFGVQVNVEDLRGGLDETFVFAGFLDVLYTSGIISPSDTIAGDDFDFDVEFAAAFNEPAAVGTAATPGIIDEFGTLMLQGVAEGGGAGNPTLMATLFFTATGQGTATVVGSPADAFPFQDTLLFNQDDPVAVSQIRYDNLVINVGPSTGGEGEAPLHNNAMPADVNNDGVVTAIDALHIINRLSRGQGEGEAPLVSNFYVDVNGDNKLTAGDALRVVNYLNAANVNRAQGEFLKSVGSTSGGSESGTSGASQADVVFADLSSGDLLTDAPVSLAPASASLASIAINDASDDEEDDVLATLANDLATL
tara:strand:+ start:100190 stop:105202 length:5013 start_codon:yes stop_codon:yes gene_type:complete